jgi:RasGEF domain
MTSLEVDVEQVIWSNLQKIVKSADRDFYTFYLKVLPFVTSKDISRICVDKCWLLSANPTEERIESIDRTIVFLIYAYDNDMVDRTTFDPSLVNLDILAGNPSLWTKLLTTAMRRDIHFNTADITNNPNVKNFNLMRVDSKEIAEKLSYICSQYFVKIRIYNLVQYAKSGLCNDVNDSYIDNTDKFYNITKLVSIFDIIGKWVPTSLMRYPNPKHQEKLVKKFVEIAMECWNLHNYHILMAIYAGLNNASVIRLKYLWSGQKYNKQIKKMGELMSPTENLKTYRAEMESVVLQNTINGEKMEDEYCIPCMPFLGAIISDFSHMLEVDFIDSNNNLVRSSLETAAIMVNRLMKMQVVYDQDYKHPEIDVVFDRFQVWPDKDLFEASKQIYNNGKLQKTQSTDSIFRSMRNRRSNNSLDSIKSLDSNNSFDNMSEVSVESNQMNEINNSHVPDTDPMPKRRLRRRSMGYNSMCLPATDKREIQTRSQSSSIAMMGDPEPSDLDRILQEMKEEHERKPPAVLPIKRDESQLSLRRQRRRRTQNGERQRPSTLRATRSHKSMPDIGHN